MKKRTPQKKNLPDLPLDRSPDRQETITRLRLLIQNGELSLAYRIVASLLESESACAELLDALGSIYLRAGALNSAYATLQQAMRLDPGCADVYLHLGQLYGERQEYMQAVTYTRRALQLQPEMNDAKDLLAKLEEIIEKTVETSSLAPCSQASMD